MEPIAHLSQSSPWYVGGIEINYPRWCQALGDGSLRRPSSIGTGAPTRFALVRNSLDVEIPPDWPTVKGEVLLEVAAPQGRTPSMIEALWYPGCGYSVHCTPLELQEPRRLSEETKQKIRRKALVRRVEKSAPLFAAEIIEEKLAEQPEYFGVKS